MKRQNAGEINREIELNPDNPVPYNKRGNIKFSLADYKGAIKDYTKAIELDPKFAEAYYRRGNAKHASGDKQGALEDLKKAADMGHQPAAEELKNIEEE